MLEPRTPLTTDTYKGYASLCREAAARLAESEIKLSYHCYDFDLRPLEDGKIGLDVLMEHTATGDFSLELDTYFIRKAGLAVTDVVDKYGDRLRMIHLNDISPDGRQAIIGTGTIDWTTVLYAVRQQNVSCCIIEHNCTAPDRWVKASLEYLRKMAPRPTQSHEGLFTWPENA